MSSSKATSKKQQVTDSKNKAAVLKASSISLDKALNALSQASVQMPAALADLSKELVSKFSELQAVEDTIAIKTKELADLHGADRILLAIDDLRVEQQTEIDRLAEERDQIVADNNNLTRQLTEARNREETEFKYALVQTRKSETDTWEEQRRVRDRNERVRQENFDDLIRDGEAALAQKTKEYTEALAKLATFDAEVEKAASRQSSVAIASFKKDFEHTAQLTKVTHESEVSNLKFDNKRMTEQYNNLEVQYKAVQEQLAKSQAEAIALAKAALDGAAQKSAQQDAFNLMKDVGGGNGKPNRA